VSTAQAAAFDYPRTYRGSRAGRVFGVIVAVGLLAAFVVMPLLLISAKKGNAALPPALLLMFLMPMTMGLYVLLGSLRSRVVLTADAIEVYGAFSTRRLMRAEIAGRRTVQVKNGSVTELIPSAPGQKSVRFNVAQFGGDSVLDAWLTSLPDLDARDRAASEAEIEANPEFGPTPEARRAWLEEAGRLAKLLNIAAVAALAAALMLRDPYRIGTLVLVILPCAAIFLAGRSHGLYRLTFERNDVRPTLALALLLPGFALALRAFQEIGVLEIRALLTYAVALAVLLAWLAFRSNPHAQPGAPSTPLLITLIALAGYSLGVVVLGNAYLDTAPKREYRVAVLAKDEHHGRSTSYQFTLAAWGPRTSAQRTQVPAALYRAVPLGGDVCVHQGPGALRISWFTVDACRN
jgi:hypothetical protein